MHFYSLKSKVLFFQFNFYFNRSLVSFSRFSPEIYFLHVVVPGMGEKRGGERVVESGERKKKFLN